MSLTVRRLIACLLIAFVPLQVIAASGMALCAEMGSMQTPQAESAGSSAPCAHMDSMTKQHAAEVSPSSHHRGGCWLGSICLAGLSLPPMPVAHPGINIERNTQTYLAQTDFFLSIIPDTPLRPPTTL